MQKSRKKVLIKVLRLQLIMYIMQMVACEHVFTPAIIPINRQIL